MRVEISVTPRAVLFNATPSPADVLVAGPARFGRPQATVLAPEGKEFGKIHPDLLALASLLIFRPWIRNSLDLPEVGTSLPFREAIHSNFKLKISGPEPSEPRVARDGARVGLAFSGGVDSIAALEVLPPTTALFFMSRKAPDDKFSKWIFNKEAPRTALRELRKQGHPAHELLTDLEFTRDPPGVPLDWSNGVPAVLLADAENLDAIAWGLVLESAYRVGRAEFQDWGHRPGYTRWAPVFLAAGLHMLHPVAGLSEIITSKIVLECRNGIYAQSCARSDDPDGCGECPKCFRKKLLTAALTGETFDQMRMQRYYHASRSRRALEAYPIKHQNVIGYALSRLDLVDPALIALRDRLSASHGPLDYFERHYAPAIDLIPEKYRHSVRKGIEKFVPKMDETDIAKLRAWDIPSLETSPVVAEAQRRFLTNMRKLL